MSIKIISRGKGKSAVAAAAYRAGEKITNSYDGISHDYTRKGGVVYKGILLPQHAPQEYIHRATLWNAVEQAEKNKNAQLSREIELALPVELSLEQNIRLVREYCKRQFVYPAGMCADICIHDKEDGNPHAHIMLTMRPLDKNGNWAAKSRKEYVLDENGERIVLPSGAFKTYKVNTVDWNDREKAEIWRASWADAVNGMLKHINAAERVDHRSYERQGVEKIPTVHMGAAASQMEKRGIQTERGDINREAELNNKILRQLRARIQKLRNWLEDQAQNTQPPLITTLLHILNDPEQQSKYQKLNKLKAIAKAVTFLQTNNITNTTELQDKVEALYKQFGNVTNQHKKTERRVTTLRKHIQQWEQYLANRDMYKKYKQQPAKKKESFYNRHRASIMLYESAKNYLDDIMNGNTKVPIEKWKAETKTLTAEQEKLYQEYKQLKEQTREVESIRRNVEEVLRDTTPNKTATKKKEHQRK